MDRLLDASPSPTRAPAAQGRQPSSAEIASRVLEEEWHRRRGRASSKRELGPWSATIASSSPRLERIGAATAVRSGSRSPNASRPAELANAADLRRERLRVGDGARRVRAERAVGKLSAREREHDLPGRGRVRDRGAAEPRDRLHVVAPRHEVDGDRVLVAGDGERRGLAGRLHELDEVRPRDLTHVEPREQRVREMDDPEAEPVAPVRAHPLDEPGGGERAELARYGARRHARPRAISFVPSSPPSASVSRTAIARSEAPMRRVDG